MHRGVFLQRKRKSRETGVAEGSSGKTIGTAQVVTSWPSAWPALALPLAARAFSTRRFGALLKIIAEGKRICKRSLRIVWDNDGETADISFQGCSKFGGLWINGILMALLSPCVILYIGDTYLGISLLTAADI